MKMKTLIYPLTLALAVSLVGAGCKHQPVKTTQLPGPPQPPMVGEGSGTTLPSTQPLPTDTTGGGGVNVAPTNPGNISTSDTWDPKNMTEDRATLAANTVHFAFDSAVVKSSEEANVQAVAADLASNLNDKLMIEGNCDERGTEEYNRSLGERRALALREALAKLNVSPERIRTISYGKDKPVDTGHDEAAFAKNRRGDFVVYHPKAGV